MGMSCQCSTESTLGEWSSVSVYASHALSDGVEALRHSAVTNVSRASRDLFLAQRFARHASPPRTWAVRVWLHGQVFGSG
jgi:hypothetical protein